jgi:hypothetical protein
MTLKLSVSHWNLIGDGSNSVSVITPTVAVVGLAWDSQVLTRIRRAKELHSTFAGYQVLSAQQLTSPGQV